MPRKKKALPPAVEAESLPDCIGDKEVITQSDQEIDPRVTELLYRLEAAGRVMEAQARLLEAYELRQSRVQALAELADARKAWEIVNG